MARTAHDPRREAPATRRLTRTVALLLAGLGLACAASQDPPGGPPDFTPPILLAASPDSGSVLTDLDQRVRFEFNEIIAERGLTDLTTVSPRPEALSVRWARNAVTVRPDGGWRPDVVYVVRIAPGLLDLRNNRLTTAVSTVFSTGGGFPATVLQGTMVNWETGRRAADGLIEAIRPTDSLTYLTRTDSAGAFRLPFLGAGDWILVATVDQDRNHRRGRREAFDSAVVHLAATDTVALVLWTFVHDSAGPVLREAQRTDSLTVRLTFGGKLTPTAPATSAVRAFLLPDTVAVTVDTVYTETGWRERLREPADTVVGQPADSIAAEPVDSVPPVPAAPDTATAPVDTLLASRPALANIWYVRLADPLRPGARYLFEVTAADPGGAIGTTRSVLVVPDTTGTR